MDNFAPRFRIPRATPFDTRGVGELVVSSMLRRRPRQKSEFEMSTSPRRRTVRHDRRGYCASTAARMTFASSAGFVNCGQ